MSDLSFPGWDRQTKTTGHHAWIQWKGTNVCMDIHCICGHHSHVDDDFTYCVKCPKCQRVFMCNGNIELVELTPEEAEQVEKRGSAPKVGS